MRELTEIVTRRFQEAVKEAAAKEEAASGRTVDVNLIADRMAEYMGAEHHSVRKQLGRYLKGAVWRVDYIQAASHALGLAPRALVSFDGLGEKAPEATKAQLLWTALGARLAADRTRPFIRVVQQLLDAPAYFTLFMQIGEALLRTNTKADAHAEISSLVLDSPAFASPRKDLRSKPRRRQKVHNKA